MRNLLPAKFESSRLTLQALSVVGVITIQVLALSSVTYAGDSTIGIDNLSLREQELKRKEDELLRAMGLATSTVTDPESSQHFDDLPKGGLDAIKYHPALEARPPTKAVSVSPGSGQIRTHFSQDHFDGTTAKRVNRFFRLAPRNSQNTRIVRRRSSLASVEEFASPSSDVIAETPEGLIATINASSKVSLKAGPSSRYKRLTTLSATTPVEIDYRKGSWYRVKTKSGVRGWTEGKYLLFNEGIRASSSIHIGGITSNAVY